MIFVKQVVKVLIVINDHFYTMWMLCNKDNLANVPNPSDAANAVTKGVHLRPAIKPGNIFVKRSGARYKKQHLPLPIHLIVQLIPEFFNGFSSKKYQA